MTASPPPDPRAGGHAARRSGRAGPSWWAITGLAVAVSFCIARAIPPWHPDGTWWGAFFTSAGFGGSLAVIGAGVASCVALHNSSRDRVQKRAADDLARWWDRFAWACEKTVSDDGHAPAMGLAVLRNLIGADWTSMGDDEMTVGIVNMMTDTTAAERPADTTAPEPAPAREEE